MITMTKQTSKNIHITILQGSPSHGWNSDTMLDAFLEGIDSVEGEITYSKYLTSDMECGHHCFMNRKGAEDHEEELEQLMKDVETSRGLVISSPTYNFAVPGGLKNTIDRLSTSIALDYQNINWAGQPTGKLGYLRNFYLVSGGTPLLAQKILFLIFPPMWLTIVFRYFGVKRSSSIYGGNLKGGHLAKDDKKVLKKCRRAGVKYAKQILKDSK
jgi:FMN-dependent NADH-azoreductase